MSRIRRLSLRGVRNFGDDNEGESTIRFQRPLTLILGPNGTGKTTIIEALKYITTGDYPPNSNSGKSFIHDPILTRTSSVRSSVKAELLDTASNVYIVSKIAECSRVNRTLKIKSIDNTFTRVRNGSKEKASLTKRCADTTTEVLAAMGVSKALLNYVIFCHQEELNWPFEEGAQLKKKFDQIFDTSRYNKALESVTKLIKTLTEENRVLKTEMEYLALAVNEVKNKEDKLESQQKRLENVRDKIAEIDIGLVPLLESIKEKEKIDTDYKKKSVEYEGKQMEYDICKQQMNSIKKNITEIFEGTIDELNEKITSHDDGIITKNNEISELVERLKHVSKEEARIGKMLAEERVTVGSLKQQKEYQQKRTDLRNNTLHKALTTWNLEAISGDISEIEVTALTKRLEEKLKELEEDMDKNRQRMENEEKDFQKEVDVLRAERSKIESEKNVKEKDIATIREEISEIRGHISRVGAAANKLNTIETQYKEAVNKVNDLQSSLDVDVLKAEIQKDVEVRDKAENELNKIDAEIASLLKQSSLQAELELHKSNLSTNEKQLDALKSMYEHDLKMLLEVNELPQDKIKEKLEGVQKQVANKIKGLTQKIQAEQHQLTTLQTTQKYDEKEYKKKVSELESDKERIASICDYKMFDDTLLLQGQTVKDLQDKRGMYAYKNVAYKQYLKELKEKDPCCPLCHRDFSNSGNVQHLITEMATEMKNHPNSLKQCDQELKTQQEKYDFMLQLKPTVAKVIQLEEVELIKLKENMEKTKSKIINIEQSIKVLQATLSIPEEKQAKCKELMNDMMRWDQCLLQIQKCQREISNLQSRLLDAGISSKRTIEEAQTERERLKTSFKTIRDRVENSQSQLNTHVEKLQQARDKSNRLHEEQLKIRSEMQKLKQLRDKQDELYSREVSLGESVQSLRQQLSVAGDTLDSAIRKLEKTKAEHRRSLNNERKVVEEGANRLFELRKLQKEVDGFLRKNIAEALSQSELQIEGYKKSMEKFADDRKSLQEQINSVKDDIARQEIKKRDLMDNLSLRKMQEKAAELNLQYKELQAELISMNHKQLVKEWNELKKEEEDLLREKNIAKGNEEELARSIKQCQAELRKDENRFARQKHKDKCVEQTVHEEVILNMKAYGKALDVAMIEYHEERMRSINKILKRLWEIVYKGTDTTSIEIRTDATDGVGSSKRTYNYKLVQKKHGKEMDMRGRCSAGQKVLASIIIRLALAETFCTNCGILALDEPTTNLDEENANSLSDALSSIIRYRYQNNKNFQLILITHDEKFLMKLAGLSDTRTFYQLYRKNNGMTGIKFCEIDNRESLDLAVKEEASSASEDEDEEDSGISTQQRVIQEKAQTSRKRWNEDDNDNDESVNNRPTKKRYVFQME